MATTLYLSVITYDISDDRARARVAKLLERSLARVQDSVFEGWLSRAAAERLAETAGRVAGPSDSVRLYLLPREATSRCRAYGFPPAPEADDFLLV